jgi:hypothetical protein
MMTLTRADGNLVKAIGNVKQEVYGLHPLFGFISASSAKARHTQRKKEGYLISNADWRFSFQIENNNGRYKLSNCMNCIVKELSENNWLIKASHDEFYFSPNPGKLALDDAFEIDKADSYLTKILMAVLILMGFLAYRGIHELPKEEEIIKTETPITVTIIKPAQTVQLKNDVSQNIETKPLDSKEVSKRAVQKNLGFLGMVGKNNLKDAVGGLPTNLKQVTAGAGAGGDAGSGGEVLTGLGKGLRKTTVGNTGVAGLGGVGTKGAGGGAGGYGNTMVASGDGAGISAIAVSNQVAMEGGLDRYVINATIAKYLSQVRRCYEDQLKYNPNLEGQVHVNFEIAGTGMLNFSRVTRSTLGDTTVEKCITTKMMSWKFPEPKGGVNVNVNYPFLLRPVGK